MQMNSFEATSSSPKSGQMKVEKTLSSCSHRIDVLQMVKEISCIGLLDLIIDLRISAVSI